MSQEQGSAFSRVGPSRRVRGKQRAAGKISLAERCSKHEGIPTTGGMGETMGVVLVRDGRSHNSSPA